MEGVDEPEPPAPNVKGGRFSFGRWLSVFVERHFVLDSNGREMNDLGRLKRLAFDTVDTYRGKLTLALAWELKECWKKLSRQVKSYRHLGCVWGSLVVVVVR